MFLSNLASLSLARIAVLQGTDVPHALGCLCPIILGFVLNLCTSRIIDDFPSVLPVDEFPMLDRLDCKLVALS